MLNTKRYVAKVHDLIQLFSNFHLLSKWWVKVKGAVCLMHIINPKKYLTNQLRKSADRRTNFFVSVFRYTSRKFTHNFPLRTAFSHSSLNPYCCTMFR